MRALGRTLAAAVVREQGAIIVGLEGELGAGKTTLVAGALGFFGVPGPVRSPTYTLVEPYEANGRAIFHLDLYRLTDPSELEPLGLREMLSEGSLLLIEWPSRAGGALPAPDLMISIEYVGDGRRTVLRAGTHSGDKLLRAIVAAKPE